MFPFGEFSTHLLLWLTFIWFVPVTTFRCVLFCKALHVYFFIHRLPSFIFTTHLWYLIIGVSCALCLAWNLSEHAHRRAFRTVKPPFLLHRGSAFPDAAGRMLRATGQAAHTICLRDGKRCSALKHALSHYAFYNICARKVSRPAGCIIPEPGCPGQSETMLLRGGCVRPYVSA